MNLREYQKQALKTSKTAKEKNPGSAVAAVLGLASETGSILDVWKRYLRDQVDLNQSKSVLEIELGDLLWYVAVVARSLNLDLASIATKNLSRAHDLYGDRSRSDLRSLPVFDKGCPATERFPRHLVIKFSELSVKGHPHAQLQLVSTRPDAFPNGPIEQPGEKPRGYQVGARLGAVVNDNSRRIDHYRYHDAIHLGFMAVLGWSPTMRVLLRIKRKHREETDRVEDGARAIYLEEGLTAVLAQMAGRRGGFKTSTNIDGEVVDVAKSLTRDLEVGASPGWLWRRAIVAGFSVMHQLADNQGGFVIADLNARTLAYSKVKP